MDADDSPITKLVNGLLVDTVDHRAWELRIEPFADRVCVQRVVGVTITEAFEHPPSLAKEISARLKVMADLDPSNTTGRQSGRIRIRLVHREEDFDFGLSVAPGPFGEKITLRLAHTRGDR